MAGEKNKMKKGRKTCPGQEQKYTLGCHRPRGTWIDFPPNRRSLSPQGTLRGGAVEFHARIWLKQHKEGPFFHSLSAPCPDTGGAFPLEQSRGLRTSGARSLPFSSQALRELFHRALLGISSPMKQQGASAKAHAQFLRCPGADKHCLWSV